MLADMQALTTPQSDLLPNLVEVSGSESLVRALLSSAPPLDVRPIEYLEIPILSEEMVKLFIERGRHPLSHLRSLAYKAVRVSLERTTHLGDCFPNLIKLEKKVSWGHILMPFICLIPLVD